MKKIITILLTAAMLLSLAACSAEENSSEMPTDTAVDAETPAPSTDEPTGEAYGTDLDDITTLDELEIQIEEHLSERIASLNASWEALALEIDTYEKYVANTEKVAAFYQTVVDETEQMCIMLYEYSAAYARMILDSDMSTDEKYDAVDGIHDCLYEDACDEIHDEIYGGLLDDMSDYFYDGILDYAQDDVSYSEWYDVCSEEYSQWYDTSSEVYELYYDAASEIYSFYYDMSGELYSQDYEKAEKVYVRFLEEIAKAKGQETDSANADSIFDTTLREAGSTEDLEAVIDAHVTECVQALWTEWETISTDIDSFDEYLDNAEAIEEFHIHIEDAASQIFVLICDYGAFYAEMILQSAASAKDMYNAFEDFKDCIYEDACEIVKDEIYEDLLNAIKDYYYEGIINDARDSLPYSDWSGARSDAYSWWSDARGEVYGNWSDTRSDLYGFYTDVRSELYSGDTEGASDELQDFKEKITKM